MNTLGNFTCLVSQGGDGFGEADDDGGFLFTKDEGF